MRKSHESLRDKYDCSCAELDELMVHSKRLGALGSRLTGAGWGGASVHLVRSENVCFLFLFCSKTSGVIHGNAMEFESIAFNA